MKKLLLILPSLLLTACNLEREWDMGRGEILIEPLSLADAAPLLLLSTMSLLLLVQAPILMWRHSRRIRRNLFTSALSLCGFTTGVSFLPLCLTLYEDTFYPCMGGPMNLGYAFGAFWCFTIPMTFSGILLVAFLTLVRWLWLARKRPPTV